MATPAGQPSGMQGPMPEAPRVRVLDVARALDFYLDLGCEVREAADGWALLRCGPVSLLLIPAPCVRQHTAVPGIPVVRLINPDVRALRRRLLARDVAVSPVTRPAGTLGEFETIDPDRHPVVITQSPPGSGSSPRRFARRPPPPGDPQRTWTSSPTARVSKNRDAASVVSRRQPAEGSSRAPSWKAIPPGAKNTA